MCMYIYIYTEPQKDLYTKPFQAQVRSTWVGVPLGWQVKAVRLTWASWESFSAVEMPALVTV